MTLGMEETRLEHWRLLIVRRDGEEILLKADGARLELPQVSIPANQRIAANINRAAERELGLHLICLYEIRTANQTLPGHPFYHAAACLRPQETVPAGAYWTLVRPLTTQSFSKEADFAAMRAMQTGLDCPLTDEPFRKPNWLREVTAWVNRALQPYPVRLTGSFEQFNASPAFSLIRFDTTGAPVWFKAIGAPNTREFALTLALARSCPAYLPKILDAKAEWNAWLAENASGSSLSDTLGTAHWENAAESLARLQTLTLSAAGELPAKGARDLRLRSLLPRVAPFFASLREMAQDASLPERERPACLDWRELCTAVEDALGCLGELHIPNAAGHMDLNPQNIFCSGQRCVFLDWAEGFVGCPFFSFEYLLQHFRRAVRPNHPLEMSFREAYFSAWREFLECRVLERACELSRLLALFAYASTLWNALEERDSLVLPQRVYFLRLARKMSRMTRKARTVCA